MLVSEKKLRIIDSLKLAEYIVFKGGAMSHLKLQKLLYYAQAYHLAYFETELIEDDFEAWVHGPVSRKLYNQVKDFSILYNEIKYVEDPSSQHIKDFVKSRLTSEQLSLTNDVLTSLAKKSGLELENMTHSETPWLKARLGYGPAEKCTKVIFKEDIKEYFQVILYGEK
jgi:uncharacterized phage-associated protein